VSNALRASALFAREWCPQARIGGCGLPGPDLGQCTASARLDDVQTRGEGRLRSGGRRKTSTLAICGRNKVCPTLYPIAKHLDFLNRVSLRDKTKILLAKPTPCDCLGKFRNIVIDGVGLITSFKAVLFEEWRSCW
jgi:hypothetical protein